MDFLKNRRVVVLMGMGLALIAGLILAGVMMTVRHSPGEASPASQGGLVVQTGRDDDIKLDPRRPLRCFVNGQLVGELPLADCARRNGVATGALDVGLDPSGALAASNGVSDQITPLPPAADAASAAVATESISESAPVATPPSPKSDGACWAYGEAGWTRLPGETSLNACVQTLYGGQCTRAGVAAYGRWADRTLRLTQGRVEISKDNRNFRLLIDQSEACAGQDAR